MQITCPECEEYMEYLGLRVFLGGYEEHWYCEACDCYLSESTEEED